ncbi:MAG: HAD-IIA family hydrolase [Bacilli bacterium]
MMNRPKYDCVCFDLDGTMYLGEKVLPGAVEIVAYLRKKKIPLRFVTNTTLKTKSMVRETLLTLGIEATEQEIITAGGAAASFLQEKKAKNVIVVGEAALHEELNLQDIQVTRSSKHATHVLVALNRQLSFEELTTATQALQKGAIFVLANPDSTCPVAEGEIPDAGSIAALLTEAAKRKPDWVLGKPSPLFAEEVEIPSTAKKCLMVGDRLETDILFGQANGWDTALLYTGVSSEEDIERTNITPTHCFENLHALLTYLKAS